MKNVKRVLALALTLLMMVTTIPAFAAFPDVDSTASYETAVSSLNQLGIITGYKDGTFKPNNNVTRAEFTAMLMRAMGVGSVGTTSSANLPFSDVSDQNSDISWAIPNIDTAYSMGIINGYEDGTFRPNDNVLYEEAVKMIVCALGYGTDISVDVDPWYSGFVSQASRLGILVNASTLGSAGTAATRACIAQMIYDSLEVPLIENGEMTTNTLLNSRLGYVRNTGYIAANDVTSLSNPDVNLRSDQIQIRAIEPNESTYSTHTYQTSSAADLRNMIGHKVEFFYQIPSSTSSDTVRTLFSYEVRETATIELTTDELERTSCTDTSIRYYEDSTGGRELTASLDNDNVVIYNGKLYGANESASRFNTSMLPTVGTITLLDPNDDGRYEVVNIWSYEMYYVSSKSSSSYTIIDNLTRPSADRNLVLDTASNDNLSIVNESGSEVTFSSIPTGGVVAYAQSTNAGTQIATAVALSNKVSGSVSQRVSGESATINGTTYNYSDAAPWITGNNAEMTEPQTGDSGTYVLDILGNLFAYDKTETVSNQYYGYVLAYNTSNDPFANDTDFQIRVLSQDGTKRDYYIYRGTTINGRDCSTSNEVISALTNSARYSSFKGNNDVTGIQQVIKYTTTTNNGRQCLDSIYTVTGESSSGQTITNDTLYKMQGTNGASFRYSNNRLSGDGYDFTISGAYVFVVPGDSKTDYDSFRKTTSSYFSSSRTYNAIEVYDVSTANSARVVVVETSADSTGVDDASPVYVINERPSQEINNGSTMWRIAGYEITKNSTSGTFNEWVSTNSASAARNAEIGDIFRVSEDSDGYVELDADNQLYNFDNPGSYYLQVGTGVSQSDWAEADFCAMYGEVYAADSSESVVIDVNGQQYTIPVSSMRGAKVLLYDNTGSQLTIHDSSGNSDEISAAIDMLNASSNLEGSSIEASKVVVYMSEGDVLLFAVVQQ